MNKDTVININPLNLDIINPCSKNFNEIEQGGSKIVVIGKPGTGKSFLISDLIYQKSDIIPVAMVFNGTEDSNHMYSQFIPQKFIYDSLNIEKIDDFVKRQKIAKEYLDNPWSYLIIDDCMDDSKYFKQKTIKNLFLNGRHYKMILILGLQYVYDIPPALRVCVDGVFILRETSLQIRKKIYDNFGSIIPDFKTFCEIMNTITDDNTSLFINNSGNSNDWRKCVFWYKAKKIPKNFRFGSNEYWKYTKKK